MRRFRQFLKVVLAIIIVIATPFIAAGIILAAYLFLPLPVDLPEGEAPNTSIVTRVLDAEGTEIATFKTFETSIPIQPGDINEYTKNAVIAAEDRRFYEHDGVDFEATMRALLADIESGDAVQGGSTISQQLVKNTITGGEKSLQRKIREAVLARQLERSQDKEQILFNYLSVIYLGEGAYGVGAAAETYFRKPVGEITLSEAATIASVIPAPSRYSPRVNVALAEDRRRNVLKTMFGEGMITAEERDAALLEQLHIVASGPAEGPATLIYPPITQESVHPYFTDYVRLYLAEELADKGGEEYLRTGGLTIVTTLDPRAQFLAQTEVNQLLDGTAPIVDRDGVEHTLQASIVSVDPPTGFVRSMIGGRDYATQQVNLGIGKLGGGSGRQPGSSFKPFVLAEAFEQGITPEKVYSGAPHVVGDTTIGNYGGAAYGSLPLRTATQKSVNTVFTRLILDVGVEQTMELGQKLGLDIPDYDGSKYGASVALGALEVSPLDMASAYGTFGNQGRRFAPTPVLQVLDNEGRVILDYTDRQEHPERAPQVLKEEVADNVTAILEGVLVNGTAGGKGINRPAAGKTGTAQENKDAWFVGYTPAVSTAVWIGYDPPSPLRGIKGVRAVTGGSHPASMWRDYMSELLSIEPVTDFSDPAPIRQIADEVQREARGGIDPGRKNFPSGAPSSGPLIIDLEAPTAPTPTTTTTSTTTTTTTTSTTRPGTGGTSTTTTDGSILFPP